MTTLALAGNPNCGKSALFNRLTGIRQTTGNWPGVTVDRKEGRFQLKGEEMSVIDLPGIYSLDASSPDEEVTRDYLLSRQADLIINIVDASNLERNLYLTVQLLEMAVPMVIVVNMMDVARHRGLRLDLERLSTIFAIPVVPIVAVTGENIDTLTATLQESLSIPQHSPFEVTHGDTVEQAITEIGASMGEIRPKANCRWLALKLLEGDNHAERLATDEVLERVLWWRERIEGHSGEEADVHIADGRFGHAHAISLQVIDERGKVSRTRSDRIDKMVLNRVVGIPIFLLVIYLMFMFTINIGSAFIDLFDGVAGAIFVDGVRALLQPLGLPEWLLVLVADGAGGGIQVVATFIPIIACLYLFLSFLEDSGYMARAAFVMDRFMRAIGLPGKAFVPMIVGFGCNVPAIMATRTLENLRERKLAILMTPFMSCGARLPVYALFAAAFFPSSGQDVVFGLYLIGITVAILSGLVMKKTLLSGESSGFMMELPPYHLPTLRGVLLRTWDRVKVFIRDAGKVIVVMVLALNVINSIGTDGSFGKSDSEGSLLSAIGREITPIFGPMGIDEQNWPATVGIFTGILAKEVVVGTLDSLYTRISEESGGAVDKPPFEFLPAMAAAFATVPENLGDIASTLLDPLGLNVGDLTNLEGLAEEQEIGTGIFGAMAERFVSSSAAFAYLLFVLLYTPCVATIGVIIRESSRKWATFVVVWTGAVAYTLSVLFYQGATYSDHSGSSAMIITAILIFYLLSIVALKLWAHRGENSVTLQQQVAKP